MGNRIPVAKAKYADLEGQHRAFVDAYCVAVLESGLTGKPADIVTAYRKAGYKGTARGAPYQIRAKLAHVIRERLEEIAKRADTTTAELMAEVDRVAMARLDQVAKWGGAYDSDDPDALVELIDSDSIDEQARAAVAQVSVTSKGTLNVKMHDKIRALELALKVRGALVERHQVEEVEPVKLYVPDVPDQIPGADSGDE